MDLSISKGQVNDVTVLVNNTEVVVQKSNNITVEVSPTTTNYVAIDRGLAGATGPQGPTGATGPQGPVGVGVPAGGTANQILTKNSSTDYDDSWKSNATLDYLQLNTAAAASIALGELRWNSTNATAAFGIVDGTIECNIGEQMYAYVTNAETITILKGQPVYLYRATGNRASVKLAGNTGDPTSAKTLGLATQDIAANQTGFVTTQGVLDKLNTSAFAEGDTLYLGATIGTLTNVKPKAPNHLVYMGVVERSNAGNGQIYVKPQNGYELDEIHDVQINSPANGQTILYDASTSLWKNANLTAGTAIAITNGASSVSIANTAPDQVVSLTGTGSTTVTGTYPNFTINSTGGGGSGTVTSVAATGGTGISVTGSPITTSGTLNIVNTAPDQVVSLTGAGTTTISGTYPNFTITSTGTGGGVTSVTGTAPVVSSGGTTPAISMAKATTSVDGYLAATDFTTFNNKGNGTVTSVSALTLGTTGTDLSSSVATGTTTPVITLNVPTASATNRGVLSSADWTTFNNKQPAGTYLTTVTADAPLSGSGTSGSHLVIATANTSTTGAISSTDWNTFNGKQAALVSGTNIKTVNSNSLLGAGNVSVGTVTSVAALTLGTTGTDLSSSVATGTTTPVVTLNVPTASAANRGALSSTDWSTFNGKQAALVSGTNIKTVGGSTLLGSGDVPVVTQIIAGTNVTISPTGGTGAVTINASGGGGGGSPAGANTEIQFNNSGSFGASSALTWDGTTAKATNVETTGGVLADGNFSGTYVDGIVVDYDPTGAVGRISVGGADGINFYNGGVAGSLLGSAASNGNWDFNGNVKVGTGTLIGGATNPLIEAAGSATGYVQVYVHNDNSGTSASADVAAYPDNGVDASGWIDMGITSSTYNDSSYLTTGANEGYIFMSAPSGAGKSGNLVYATDSTGSSNAHQWYVGGFGQAKSAYKMQLDGTLLYVKQPIKSDGLIESTTGGFKFPDGTTQTTAASGAGTEAANTVLAAPNGSAGTPTFRSLVSADIPDLLLTKLPEAWVKMSCQAATTANITLSGTQTVDGVALIAGNRCLVKNQTAAQDNGIYDVSAGAWTRSADASLISEIAGSAVNVDAGTVNGGKVFDTDFKTTDTLGTTAMNWYPFVDANGATFVGSVTLRAGTATAGTAPLYMTSGTSLTTAQAGAVEYDGNTFYSSIAASTRGVLPSEQIVVLTGTNTLTSQTAVQPIFDGGGGPTNGSVTLPIGTYQYECSFAATGLSATSGSFGFALGGAATKTYTYQAQASKAGTSLTTPMATVSTFGTAANTTLVANSTGTVANLLVKGIIRVTVAGTVIPQISLTVASAGVIQAGSYFKVSPLGNVSTVATVGNWA